METVREKIQKEYEIFFLDMTRTSRANIFASSREIEIKKAIFSFFKEEKLEERQEMIVLACDNLLEELYRYVIDYMTTENQVVRTFVETWLEEKTK